MPSLPDDLQGAVFDMDGVLTDTASVHQEAWKATFDAFLRERDGDDFQEFTHADYDEHVDGLPREDGVRGFLASRHIEADDALVDRLAEDKNDRVLKLIDERGVKVFDGSIELVKALRARGVKTAVASSSANTKAVLESAKIADLFDARVDGVTLKERHIPGKPKPDMFLAAAKEIGVDAARAAVFEDAQSGVAAGHAGHFRVVVGVDRADQAQALRDHGADFVVDDLAELL